MKKSLFLLAVFLPFMALGQIETSPSSSLGEYTIGIKKFLANVEITNSAMVENLILRPDPRSAEMYLAGNFGSIEEQIQFSRAVKSSTAKFTYVNRVMELGTGWKLITDTGDVDMVKANIFKDLMSKKILVIAEFVDPETGQIISKNLELNLKKAAEPGGDRILASAEITNENLGLRVVKLKGLNQLGFDAYISNPQLGGFAVRAGSNRELSFLGSKNLQEGVYTFSCEIQVPGTAIIPKIPIRAMLIENELSLDFSIFNPGNIGDTLGSFSLTTLRNGSSVPVMMLIPKHQVGERKNPLSKVQNKAVLVDAEGIEWEVVSLAPKSSSKIYLRYGWNRAIRYNNGRSAIIEYSVERKKTQRITIM